jgi:hypothetical protein
MSVWQEGWTHALHIEITHRLSTDPDETSYTGTDFDLVSIEEIVNEPKSEFNSHCDAPIDVLGHFVKNRHETRNLK